MSHTIKGVFTKRNTGGGNDGSGNGRLGVMSVMYVCVIITFVHFTAVTPGHPTIDDSYAVETISPARDATTPRTHCFWWGWCGGNWGCGCGCGWRFAL